MQGSMVMPELSYYAADGALYVTMDPTIPQLTPLLVSNPGDSFDPADPWFDALDPSRQGLAFSRRYGFVMGTATDQLPAGTGIWIRKLSGSAQLGFYRAHAMSLPHRWEPIFGTAGTTNVFAWSGTMFHPCVTAPPGTDTYEATFEAFLVNTNTGVEVPNSSTGPFTLNWTSRARWPPGPQHRAEDRHRLAGDRDQLRARMCRHAAVLQLDPRYQRARDGGRPAGGGFGRQRMGRGSSA